MTCKHGETSCACTLCDLETIEAAEGELSTGATGYVSDPDNKQYYKRLQKSFNEAQLELLKRRERIEKLEKALERLGSMEAFTYTRAVHDVRDKELLARIDYARQVLET
jgi:hypothetical protein